MTSRTMSLLAALVVAAALVPFASARPTTTEPASLRLVKVTLSPTSAKFTRKQLERGTIAQFDIRNVSKVPLRFVVGTARGPVVKPGKTTQMLVHLNVRGALVWQVLAGGKRTARGSLTVV